MKDEEKKTEREKKRRKGEKRTRNKELEGRETVRDRRKINTKYNGNQMSTSITATFFQTKYV